jgi:pseudouridine synthase
LERLQKFISQAGIASRRAAEKMIQEGRVSVNGKVVTELGVKVDPLKDKVSVDGKPVKSAEKMVYYLLNKPKGYLSTAKDDRDRKTVIDLLQDIKQRVYPVGRLDNNTEGLLLLTNDGTLMNQLLHPKYEIYKTYVVKVDRRPEEEKLDKLRAGIKLDDGLTAPAKVYVTGYDPLRDLTTLEVTIHEGRNRQVRRMFAAIGHDVKGLKRIEFAGLTLSGLRRGQYRELTAREIEMLQSLE